MSTIIDQAQSLKCREIKSFDCIKSKDNVADKLSKGLSR